MSEAGESVVDPAGPAPLSRPAQPRTASPVKLGALVIGAPFGALLVCGLSLASGISGDEMTMIAIAMVTMILCLLPSTVQQLLPPSRRQMFMSLFCLSYFVHFVVPVFTEYLWVTEVSLDPMQLSAVQARDVVVGQLAALVALVALFVGFALPFGRLVSTVLPMPRYDWGERNTLIVALAMIPFGWMVFLVGQLGLIPSSLGSGFLGSLSTAFYFGNGLLAIAYLRYGSRGALMILFLLLPPGMALAFFTGSKKLFLAPMAVVALAHIVVSRRVQPIWMVGGVVAIVFLYPVASFYREVVQQGNQLSAMEVLSNPGQALSLVSAFLGQVSPMEYIMAGIDATSNRLSGLGILSVILRDTPSTVPFQEGWSLSYVVLSFIPRVIWPDKPNMSIGQWVTDQYGAGPQIASHTGPTPIGELFFNFGWPGIIVGMLLVGVLFRILSEFLFRENAPTPALIAAVVALWNMLLNLQGAMTGIVTGFVFTLVPIMFAHLVVRTLLRGLPQPGAPPGHST